MRGLAVPPAVPDLESASAQDVLAHMLEQHHPRLALACSFQKEEAVLIDMLMRLEPTARVFTIDTGVLFPETYQAWRDLERHYGVAVEIFDAQRPADARWDAGSCCSERKVAALDHALEDLDGWITGLRREQSPTRSGAPKLAFANIWDINVGDGSWDFSDGTRTSLPDFLFDVRRGNCEYFATAAAILLRHAGVPTRIVTGFHADEWNEWGRFYDVRQSQAHAWTEAWIPGKGWLTYDATPAESGLSAAADEFSRRVGRWFDVLQARWYRSVVGYDQYSQRDAFLSMSFARVFDGISKFADRLFERGLPVVLVLGLAFLAWKARPSLRRPVDEYESAERALARAGVRRAPAQTPREFARAVSAARPELAALADLAEAHYRRRYAGLAPGSDDRRRAAELLRELKSRL